MSAPNAVVPYMSLYSSPSPTEPAKSSSPQYRDETPQYERRASYSPQVEYPQCMFCAAQHIPSYCYEETTRDEDWSKLYKAAEKHEDDLLLYAIALRDGDAETFRTIDPELQFLSLRATVAFTDAIMNADVLLERDFRGTPEGRWMFDTKYDMEVMLAMLQPILRCPPFRKFVLKKCEELESGIRMMESKLARRQYYDEELEMPRCDYDPMEEVVGGRPLKEIVAEKTEVVYELKREIQLLVGYADRSAKYE